MKQIASLVLVLAAGAVWAGGPTNQTAKFGSVVRILSGLTDETTLGNFEGSGTIIANRNIGGKGWLAILSADHVVSKNQRANGATHKDLGIGLGSTITGNSAGMRAGYVGRMGGQKVDLAVLGIQYGDYAANLRVVRTVAATSADQPPAAFTMVGYGQGLDADPAKNEWKADGVSGECRFGNNKSFTISAGAVATQNGYENQVVEWRAFAPNDPKAVLGQGVPFLGDSGGPLFTAVPDKESINGTDIPLLTNGVFAVSHTITARAVAGVPVAVPYNGLLRSVYLNADYRKWIDEQVKAVPEPGSIAGLGIALLLMARRRIK